MTRSNDHQSRGFSPTPRRRLQTAPAWLIAVTRHAATAPRAVLTWSAILAVFALVVGIRFLPLSPSRAELIGSDEAFHKRWLAYTEEFGEQSELIVVVSSASAVQTRNAAESIATGLKSLSSVESVLGRVDWTPVERRRLQYLTTAQLSGLEARLRSQIIPAATGSAGLASISSTLTAQLQSAADIGSPAAWSQGLSDVESVLDVFDRWSAGNSEVELWGLPQSDVPLPQPNVFESGRTEIISCYPRDATGIDGAKESVLGVRSLLDAERARWPDCRIGLTGVPVLEFDEMDRSSRDMALASSLSAIGVAVLLCLGFRGSRVPLVALVVLTIALVWSVGWAAMAVGRLNILSVSFAAILIGLGIDFALHWLAHLEDAEQELSHDATAADTCVRAAASSGTGIATAAVTTSTAFMVAGVTPFRGLAELGIIAGGGVVLCALAALVVTPAVVSLWPKSGNRPGTPRYAYRLAGKIHRSPLFSILISATVIGFAVFLAFDFNDGYQPRIRYDSNLLRMQPVGLPSVEVQRELEAATAHGLLFAVSRASSAAEANRLAAHLERLPESGSVVSLGRLMPAVDLTQSPQFERVRTAVLVPVSTRFAPADVDDTLTALEQLRRVVSTGTSGRANAVVAQLDERIAALSRGDEERVRIELDAFAQFTAERSVEVIEQLRSMSAPSPISAAILPIELTRRFVGPAGTWLVLTFPAKPIWEPAPLGSFVAAIRAVDPEVTGTPIQNFEATEQIRTSYVNACGFALAAVFLILFLDASTVVSLVLSLASAAAITAFSWDSGLGSHWQDSVFGWSLFFTTAAVVTGGVFDFRGAAQAIGAATPSILGALITVGVLTVLRIDFNPANLIVLPLVLGIGVDDGVHILHGLRGRRGQVPAATLHALTMTSLTSAIGFGSLAISAHRGLASLGVTLVVGVAACYLVSIFFLLPVAYLLRTGRGDHEIEAVDYDAPDRDAVERDSRETEILSLHDHSAWRA